MRRFLGNQEVDRDSPGLTFNRRLECINLAEFPIPAERLTSVGSIGSHVTPESVAHKSKVGLLSLGSREIA